MKKVGVIIFAIALVIGLIVSNLFSFGRFADRLFNFKVNVSGVKGSGNVSSERRDVDDFKGIDVGGIFQVEITAQKDFAVEVEADDNLLPLITTEVSGGVLKIHCDGKLSPTSPIRVRVSAPDIDNLEVSGAANVSLDGIDNSTLNVDSSGASKIHIAGETAKLIIDVSGATKIDAAELKAAEANVDASGASQVSVNVTGDLRTDASGASRIVYSGSPTNVEKSTSGASSVSAK